MKKIVYSCCLSSLVLIAIVILNIFAPDNEKFLGHLELWLIILLIPSLIVTAIALIIVLLVSKNQ